jgi:hypothetical protein
MIKIYNNEDLTSIYYVGISYINHNKSKKIPFKVHGGFSYRTKHIIEKLYPLLFLYSVFVYTVPMYKSVFYTTT